MFSFFPREFFEPPADQVAPVLLGHYLIRNTAAGPCGGPIVEAEAYVTNDPACHAFIGETPRNRAMWGRPGHAYVYLIYGFHFCVNVVCRPAGVAEAILIRAIEPEFGISRMKARRKMVAVQNLTSGPGKLCSALRIDRSLDGTDLCDPKSELWIARNPAAPQLVEKFGPVSSGPRIGITRAADWPLRFFLVNAPSLSRRLRRGKSLTSVQERGL